jgi:hypothetical protein
MCYAFDPCCHGSFAKSWKLQMETAVMFNWLGLLTNAVPLQLLVKDQVALRDLMKDSEPSIFCTCGRSM